MKTRACCEEEAALQECLRAARVIARWMGSRLDALGLTPQKLEILDVLVQEEGLPLSRLRDLLCCVGSNVTALVDRLEREGLVERRRDPGDRRVIRLYLSASGREKLALLGDPRRCCPETPALLTPEERRTLVRLLRKVVAGMGGGCAGAPCCGEGNGGDRG